MKSDSIDHKLLEQINKDAETHFIKNEFILSLFEVYNTVDEKEKERYIKQSESVRKKLLTLPNDSERRKHQININFKKSSILLIKHLFFSISPVLSHIL